MSLLQCRLYSRNLEEAINGIGVMIERLFVETNRNGCLSVDSENVNGLVSTRLLARASSHKHVEAGEILWPTVMKAIVILPHWYFHLFL